MAYHPSTVVHVYPVEGRPEGVELHQTAAAAYCQPPVHDVAAANVAVAIEDHTREEGQPPSYDDATRTACVVQGVPVIQPPTKVTSTTWHAWCLFLTLAVVGFLIGLLVSLPFNQWDVVMGTNQPKGECIAMTVLMSIAYLVYLGHARWCEVTRYLANKQGVASLCAYVTQVQRGQPQLCLTVRCSHTETRTRTVSSGSGKDRRTHTETYTVTVTTFTQTEAFAVQQQAWSDHSDSVAASNSMGAVSRVESAKQLLWGNAATQAQFETHKEAMLAAHRHRDVRIDFHSELLVPGMQRNILCINEGAAWPWWMDSRVFFAATVCLLSWPYRLWMYAHTDGLVFHFRKMISNDYTQPIPAPTVLSVTGARSQGVTHVPSMTPLLPDAPNVH